MTFDLASAVIGLLAGALMTASFVYPRIARAVGKIMAVLFLGLGAGLLAWGLYTAIRGESLREMDFGPIVLVSVGQTLGWASGCLAAGIASLVLAFVGRLH